MSRDIRRPGPRGSVIVEFVIVLPLLILLFLAAIDWGWYFVLRENVVHATREGARVGSVAPDEATARTEAIVATRAYLTGALGARRARDPEVRTDGLVGSHRVISVRLTGYPAGSITGLRDLTRVPDVISARSDMRLEVQP